MPGPLSPTELQEILGFTTDLARKAGALILEGSYAIQRAPGPGSVGEKKNAVDLVTEYDVRVEELVRNEIARAYPHFHLLAIPFRDLLHFFSESADFFFFVYSIGEESYSSGTRPPLTDSPTFCVDPIGKFPDLLTPTPHHHHNPPSLLPSPRDRPTLCT